MLKLFTSFFGSRNERLLKQMGKITKKINEIEPSLQALSDTELQAKHLSSSSA